MRGRGAGFLPKPETLCFPAPSPWLLLLLNYTCASNHQRTQPKPARQARTWCLWL
jgi:hypothetical protein